MPNNKKISVEKKIFIVIGIIITIVLVASVSYAYWQTTETQTGENKILTGCFDVEFVDANDINIENAYPMNEMEATSTLTPYTFTLTNNCSVATKYQVNLEVLEEENNNANRLGLEYVATHVHDVTRNIKSKNVFSEENEVEPTLNNADTAYTFSTGFLEEDNSATYNLLIWMDENTSLIAGQNKIFSSKVTVTMDPTTKEQYCLINTDIACAGGTLMLANSNSSSGQFLNTNINKIKINSIIFEKTDVVPNDALGSFDVSEAQDESVMLWYYDSTITGQYDVHIGSKYGIKANSDSSYLFSYLSKVNTIDLTAFYTQTAINMSNMFLETGSFSSSFAIDLSNFNTSNVTDMSSMFSMAGSSNMSFTLNLSSFDTSNVANMSSMFSMTGYGNSNFSLDFRSFDFSKVELSNGILVAFKATNQIRVKNQASKDFILNNRADLSNVVIG